MRVLFGARTLFYETNAMSNMAAGRAQAECARTRGGYSANCSSISFAWMRSDANGKHPLRTAVVLRRLINRGVAGPGWPIRQPDSACTLRLDQRGTGVAEAAAGGLGSTTTRAAAFTRPYRSTMSSLTRRMQPEETNWPMVEGWLVP